MVIDLDHVALALQDVGPTLRTLVTDFGTPVLFGGVNFGFRAVQVDGGDLHIELLEPFNTEANDFLERFLRRSGEGPHHLTFKTDDIRRELEAVERAGYNPVNVNLENAWWMELEWPGGGRVRIELAAGRREGIDRLEWTHTGRHTERTVGGTRFVLYP